jgi:glycosyltransferase 2 family protein
MVRTPTSLLQLVVGTTILAVGTFAAWRYANAGAAANFDAEDLTRRLPEWIRLLPLVLIGAVLVLLPVFVNLALLVRRRWRLLLVVNLAAIAAVVLSEEIVALVTRVPPSRFPEAYLVDGARETPNAPLFSGMVAAFVVGLPYLRIELRRAGYALIAAHLLATLSISELPTTGWFVDLGAGIACGAAVALAFGTPDRRPGRRTIVEALGRSGVHLAELDPASVDARGSTPWFGTTVEGERLFIKVLDGENRSADLLFRLVRFIRLRRSGGDLAPFSSLRRAVEHEALLSLRATSVGLPTPELVAVSEIGHDGMLLAYRAIDGASLDAVEDADLTDDVLARIWALVADMRAAGIAHRDLRLANVFLARSTDGSVEPLLIDFGFAELAAPDMLLDSDVAELLASTAPRVGVERAVDAAEQVLGTDALRRSVPRLQPLLLGTATRTGLKRTELFEPLRTELGHRTGRAEEPPVEHLHRPGVRSAFAVAFTAVAVWILIPQFADASGVWRAVRDADWEFAGFATAASLLSYLAAALAVQGSVRDPLPVRATVLEQFAATFSNAITPASIGGLTVNVRFLQRYGIDLPVAVSAVGLNTVAGLVVHAGLLLVGLERARGRGDVDLAVPSSVVVLGLAVACVALVGLLAVLPAGRRLVLTQLVPVLRRSVAGLRDVATRPVRLIQLFGGSLLVTVTYAAALVFSVRAFGGTTPATTIALVYLAGAIVAAAAPTPGGLGAAEAAYVAGLHAAGEDPAVAIPAVFLFRGVTFWLPLLPGWFALHRLRRSGRL